MTIWQRDVVAAAIVLVTTVGLIGQEPDEGFDTITGEVVEMMCYQRIGDDALGERHAECALKCATSGTDLAIRSSDGLHIITGAAAGTDELFAFIARNVRTTGRIGNGNDYPTIDIGFTEPEDEVEAPVMMMEVVDREAEAGG